MARQQRTGSFFELVVASYDIERTNFVPDVTVVELLKPCLVLAVAIEQELNGDFTRLICFGLMLVRDRVHFRENRGLICSLPDEHIGFAMLLCSHPR